MHRFRTVDQARADEAAWAALAWGAEQCADDPELDEMRVVVCPECGGDCGFEREEWIAPDFTRSHWVPCTFCDGTGEIQTEPADEPEDEPVCAFCGGSGFYMHEPDEPWRSAYPRTCPECNW